MPPRTMAPRRGHSGVAAMSQGAPEPGAMGEKGGRLHRASLGRSLPTAFAGRRLDGNSD